MTDTRAGAAEELRIRDAYARRGADNRTSWFSPGHRFMLQTRERDVLPLLAAHGFDRLDGAQILEVGCGTGQWLRDFIKWGARPEHIVGVDLLADRLADARRVCPSGVTLICGNASVLEFGDGSFDIVLQSTMFTSILDAGMRRAIAAEMVRVVRPGGVILWYDYHVDNPSNPDVRGVPKREIRALFPHCELTLRRTTLAPPLARAIAPYSHLICTVLDAVPFLRTHYLAAIRKPGV